LVVRNGRSEALRSSSFLVAVTAAFLAANCGGANSSKGPPRGEPEATAGQAPPEGAAPDAGSATPPPQLAEGERLFDANCAACHGPRGTGTDHGPPLVHIIYEPNHHSDAAFQLAAKNGVRAHHWTFGDMPPVPGVTSEQVTEIVAYVRWLQRQAGIE
jgi:mono/diheme cytochrome c family protein